jgi:hypothetical protein
MFVILYLGFSNFFENNNFTFIDNIISKDIKNNNFFSKINKNYIFFK